MYTLDNVDLNIRNNQHLILDFDVILRKNHYLVPIFFYMTKEEQTRAQKVRVATEEQAWTQKEQVVAGIMVL